VTAGCGCVQRSGGPIELVLPGEKHWHGGTPTTGMTHIAIQEKKDGKVVDWMEHALMERVNGKDQIDQEHAQTYQ
jgi:quercetin dioxygenase-like cupin family protein